MPVTIQCQEYTENSYRDKFAVDQHHETNYGKDFYLSRNHSFCKDGWTLKAACSSTIQLYCKIIFHQMEFISTSLKNDVHQFSPSMPRFVQLGHDSFSRLFNLGYFVIFA